MTGCEQKNTNVRLLACLVDEDDNDDSDYRFLVDGQHVKYVTTAPGTFRGNEEDRTFEPILLGELFPSFPPGSWNSGRVAMSKETGDRAFVKTEKMELAGIANLWHPVILNERDFIRQDRIRQRVHVSTHPGVNGGKPVLVKLAVWPWEIPYMETETAAYQWLSNSGIGPKFLGHLAESKDGRIVGFVTELLQDVRTAESTDLGGCRKALAQLHELGIMLGDINKRNFLVRDGHDVVLVDFETAKRDCSAKELKDEMDALRNSLEDTSYRGGVESIHE